MLVEATQTAWATDTLFPLTRRVPDGSGIELCFSGKSILTVLARRPRLVCGTEHGESFPSPGSFGIWHSLVGRCSLVCEQASPLVSQGDQGSRDE